MISASFKADSVLHKEQFVNFSKYYLGGQKQRFKEKVERLQGSIGEISERWLASVFMHHKTSHGIYLPASP
jgi:hypothetical protein